MYNECKHRDRLMHEIANFSYSNNETEKLYEALDNWKKYGKNMKTNNNEIVIMQSLMNELDFKGFLRGNVIALLANCNLNYGIENLNKARNYLNKLIELETSK